MTKSIIMSLITIAATFSAVNSGWSVPITSGGPGGFSETNSASEMRLWLRADVGMQKDDGGGGFNAAGNTDSASRWLDQSFYNNDATQTTGSRQPTYETGVGSLNGMPTVSFETSGGTQNFDLPDFMNFSNPTIYVLGLKDAGGVGMLFGSGAHSTDTTLQFRWHTSVGAPNGGYWVGVRDGSSNLIQTLPGSGSSPGIFDYHLSGLEVNGQTATVRYNGSTIGSGTEGAYVSTNFDTAAGANNSPNIGVDANGSTYALNGDVAEVVVFDGPLNSVERALVDNHMASKYDIGPIPVDRYNGDHVDQNHYDSGVFGIGNDGSSTVTIAGMEGLGIESISSLDTNDWVLAGHKNISNGLTSADMPLGDQRWQQVWYLDQTSADGVEATLTFDWSDSGLSTLDPKLSRLLYSSGNAFSFSVLDVVSSGYSGDQISFTVPASLLVDGYFTLGSQIPEPSTGVMMAIAGLGLMRLRRRRMAAGARQEFLG